MAAQIQNRDRNSPSQRNITPPSSMEFSAAISAPGSYNHCKSGFCRICTYTYLLVFGFCLMLPSLVQILMDLVYLARQTE